MSSNTDLEANKAIKPNKSFCKHCNRKGHIESKCYIKYPELRKTNKSKNKDKKSPNKDKKTESSKAIMSAFSIIKGDSNNKLILDSGATEHYTPNKEWLTDYKIVLNKTIIIADGTKVPIEGVGNIPIIIGNKNVLIKDVYYISSLKTTLISSKELTNKGWTILFKDNIAELSNIKFKLNIKAKWNYNAYYLDAIINYDLLEPVIYKISKTSKLDLIHKRLNHLNKDYLIKSLNSSKGLIRDKDKEFYKEDLSNCDSCYEGKFTKIGSKEPFTSTSNLIYLDIDIAGPFRTSGLKGERYFLAITDRGTRTIWVYPIKFKSDALDILISFYKIIETQFNTKIKALRLDNAKEFKSSKWDLFCKNKGIICEYTSPYSPSQNGISERLNRFLIERLIAISKEKNIPLKLWPYLLQAIAHIKNRTYNPIINKTPYEALIGTKPNIDYIRILGSLAYTLIPKEKRLGKLESKANKGILVGFESSNNFLVYIPSLNKVISTKDILIKEDLDYNDNYIIKEDNYNSLLDDLELNNLDSNIELGENSTNNSTKDSNIRSNNIEDNSELEGENNSNRELLNKDISNREPLNKDLPNREITSNRELSSNLDELNSEYYSDNTSIRVSKRLKGEVPSN